MSLSRLITEYRARISQHYFRFLLDAEAKAQDTLLEKFENSVASNRNSVHKQQDLYCATLRSHPTWFRGHLMVGRMALKEKDFMLAYGSAKALQLLAENDRERAQALGLLGEAQLLAGKLADAEISLQKSISLFPLLRSKERTVSCLVSLGKKEEAKALLVDIPEDQRSPETALLQEYLNNEC